MSVESNAMFLTYFFSVIGLLYGSYNIYKVLKVNVTELDGKQRKINEEDDDEVNNDDDIILTQKQADKLTLISSKIADGADVFLYKEYTIILIFIGIFSIIIAILAEEKRGTFYATIAFIIGSVTSLLCGFIGMKIATASNYRTTFKALYFII